MDLPIHTNNPRTLRATEIVTCKCGKIFRRYLKIGKNFRVYCSNQCSLKDASSRILGEKNPFYGKKHTEETRNKIAQKMKGTHPKSEFKSVPEEQHPRWKGKSAGYSALHKWVQKHKGKALCCEKCDSFNTVEWANLSHEYKRDLTDWIGLCKKCHIKFDRKHGWGDMKKRYASL